MRQPSATPMPFRLTNRMRQLATRLDPVAALPATPRETAAAVDAMVPSLMPRTASLQGIAMGLSVRVTRSTIGILERFVRPAVPEDAPLLAQLGARAAVGGAG